MSAMVNSMNGHPPLQRLSGTRGSLVDSSSDLEQTHTEKFDSYLNVRRPMPATTDLPPGILLPTSFVSVPTKEDNHVSLKPQSVKGAMSNEQHNNSAKTWHHKAIRRNLSKAKELVLFVGKLPENLPTTNYVSYATKCTKVERSSIGPVFPSLGCFFITFSSGTAASTALKLFRVTRFRGEQPDLLLLPYINIPTNIQAKDHNPLLVFINCKSGGRQGSQLYDLLMETLNPYQIFLMDKGGALPGLYAFRKLHKFRVLVCGGDGTVGWVLSHLEIVRRHLTCTDPSFAILPVGTGNDLARVLGFGSSWSGENVAGVVALVQDTQRVKMDRWNILFNSHETEKPSESGGGGESKPLLLSDAVSFDEASPPPGDAQEHGKAKRVNVVMSMGDKARNGHSAGTSSPVLHKKVQRGSTPNLMLGLIPVLSPLRTEQNVNPSDSPISTTIANTNRTNRSDDSVEKMAPFGDDDDDDKVSGDSTVVDVIQGCTSPESVACSTADHSDTHIGPPDVSVEQEGLTDVEGQTKNESDTTSSESDDDFVGDDLTRSDSFGEVRRRQSKGQDAFRRNRLVHILSQSDIDLDPVDGDSDATRNLDLAADQDAAWEAKLDQLRLNVMDPNPSDLDSSSQGRSSSSSSSESLDEEESANLGHQDAEQKGKDDDQLSPLQSGQQGKDDDQLSPLQSGQSTRHYSVTSDSVVGFRYMHNDSIRVSSQRKKYSLPAIPSYQSQDEEHIPEPPKGLKMVAMSNYLGVGIDAELNLAFHLAREENPERCTSRFHNKALYFKAGLKKMTSRSVNLNNVIDLVVDDVTIQLPSVKGLIFLNIGSWGAGGNAWGSGPSRRFATPSMGDGMLEVIGVSGVAHMSQIYSGLRAGIRIAQGEYIRLNLKAEVAVQVDGEPWMQPPGKIIITVAPTQVTMLKRVKKKTK